MYNIHLLPALFGDSILIEFGKKESPKYILIDGGPYYGFEKMMAGLNKVAPKIKVLELLVITHIDIDHIDGLITLLNRDKLPFKIKELWFNGWEQLKPIPSSKLGALQGEYVSIMVKKHKLKQNDFFDGKAVMVKDAENLPEIPIDGGMKLTLLSPHLDALKKLKDTWKKEIDDITSEDSISDRWKAEKRYLRQLPSKLGAKKKPPHPDISVANGSSIAFIATYDNKSCLFAGDTMSKELVRSIEPLCKKKNVDKYPLNAWKLAHHGSGKSTQASFINKIVASKILISTNGDRYKHPDKICLETLLSSNDKGLELYFNYESTQTKIWKNKKNLDKYGHKTHYGSKKGVISVSL